MKYIVNKYSDYAMSVISFDSEDEAFLYIGKTITNNSSSIQVKVEKQYLTKSDGTKLFVIIYHLYPLGFKMNVEFTL